VEDKYGRILHKCSRDGESLALAAAEFRAAVAYIGVIAFFFSNDEVMRIGHLSGVIDFLFCRIILSKPDVVEDSIVEENWLLCHDAHEPAHGLQRIIANVNSIDQHLA